MSTPILPNQVFLNVGASLMMIQSNESYGVLYRHLKDEDIPRLVESWRVSSYECFSEEYSTDAIPFPIQYNRTLPLSDLQLLKALEKIQEVCIDDQNVGDPLDFFIFELRNFIIRSIPGYNETDYLI